MSMKKYFQIIGFLLLVSALIGFFGLAFDLFKEVDSIDFSDLFIAIFYLVVYSFFAPALGLLFVVVSDNMENIDRVNVKITNTISSNTKSEVSNSTDSEYWYCECGNRVPNNINECHNCGKKR